MAHIDCSNVTNFSRCKLDNTFTMSRNQDFNCLQPFTRNHKCSKQVCRQCYKRRHILLDIDRQLQSNNDKVSASFCPADAIGSSTAEIKTYCSFKGKPRNHILFATAIVEIQNKFGQYFPRRVLLDGASQSHLITKGYLQRLMLSRTQTHASIRAYPVLILRHITVCHYI